MSELTEAALKKTVAEYLSLLQKQGMIYYDRLQSGHLMPSCGGKKRMINLCRNGTSDFLVLNGSKIIFLELKSGTGRQRPEQKLFQQQVESKGALYFIVRDLEDVKKAIEQIA